MNGTPIKSLKHWMKGKKLMELIFFKVANYQKLLQVEWLIEMYNRITDAAETEVCLKG